MSGDEKQGTTTRRLERLNYRKRPTRPVGRRSGSFVVLLVLVLALNLIGLVMVLSASSVTALNDNGTAWYHFERQGLWLLIAVAVMLVTMRIDYHRWAKLATPSLFVAVALLVAVLLPGIGVTANGSTRWIGLGPIHIQPSEVAKLALIIWVADLLARRSDQMSNTRVTIRPVLAVLVLVAVLILRQPNLGSALVIGGVAFIILFAAGAKLAPLAAWGLAGGGIALWLAISESYRKDRVLAFLDPWEDPLNTGYQTIQSLVGIASGGVSGVGLGAGRAKWGYLPFAHTDFIFAVIAEELGMVGATTVIVLFVLLGITGLRVALDAPDRFGSLLAAGITAWFVLQAFVNIGAVVGVLPITGVPLPFLSFGGSALVVSTAAAGVLLNVARQAR